MLPFIYGRCDAPISSPPSVLVVGGGPAGLATALEAHLQGYTVTLVEQRETYTRQQWVFLNDTALDLLKKWNVRVPTMIEVSSEESRFLMSIRQLEMGLEQRVQELGIQIIRGEFKNFEFLGTKADHIAHIVSKEREEWIPYDFIVGADGCHSRVREELGIATEVLGAAVGTSFVVPSQEDADGFDLSWTIPQDNRFLRRFKTPFSSIVSMQFPDPISKDRMYQMMESCGWGKEVRAIQNNQAVVLENINVTLQQTDAFSQKTKGALLVGEAAASASFLQAKGANTALKTAEIAGKFFSAAKEDLAKAFDQFNQEMKQTTQEMIDDSKFLFQNQDQASIA